MTTYSERLKDPRWQRRRLEILQRSDFSCEDCEATDKTLHVHHKLYRKGAMPWEYADHELEALCEDCHEKHHATRDRLNAVLAELHSSDIEEVLGFALATHAVHEVFAEDLNVETERTWKVTTWSEARGFAMQLLRKMPPAEVEELLEIQLLNGAFIGRVIFSLNVHGLPGSESNQ